MQWNKKFESKTHFINYINKIIRLNLNCRLPEYQLHLVGQIYDLDNILDYKSLNLCIPSKAITAKIKKSNDVSNIYLYLYEMAVELKEEIDEFHQEYGEIANNFAFYKDEYYIITKYLLQKEKIQYFVSLYKKRDFGINFYKILNNIINKSGIYYLHNKNDDIIYIGKSMNLSNRIFNSIKNKKEAIKFSYILIKNKADLQIIEPYLINIFKPILNDEFKTNNKPSFVIEIPEISKIYNIEE